ncbi:MAG: DNA mismatch repair protein MutS, partial [Dehalococcoidales bacterium]|nr:DNA mismatch repair protein MutS [Dehalococcoidales bacterium]
LVSLVLDDEAAGIAYVDITTSDFAVTQVPLERVNAELERLKASEIITANSSQLSVLELAFPLSRLEDYCFELNEARQTLLKHFGVASLDGYGCSHLPLAVRAAGAIISYIRETQKGVLGQLTRLTTYSTDSFMALDAQTQKNLELFYSGREHKSDGSLLSVIDLTRTPMGSRLLKRWLGQPLLDITELNKRQDIITWFFDNTMARNQTTSWLDKVGDLERLINRIRSDVATPRELIGLKQGLEVIPQLIEVIDADNEDSVIGSLRKELKPRQDVIDLITEAIEDLPPSSLSAGGVVRRGFSEELDSLRLVAKNAKQYLANLERQEREKTGIKSLKVGFNRVFGYYIEVSKANLGQVPQSYIRKQTLVGGERFFTPELKEYESLILNAHDRIGELESGIFHRICHQVSTASDRILAVASVLANIDVFSSLAEVAVNNSYVRPRLTLDSEIVIKGGRHPVVERGIPTNSFVPNDTYLSNGDTQLIVLTGPNMSGKSTYLRQVALSVLLAQMGSFIPAESATIGLVDRIFTRIGAGEDIAAGQSTFMVEMVETANILNNATQRSLIILDEIGRGTSTYDGLAIAQAVCEYIHNDPRLGAKTLFATHYHELVELASVLPRVKNFNVAVTEEGGRAVFLYKIVPGGVDKSYGIHVAQLAGLPKPVVQRADEVLKEMEEGSSKKTTARESPGHKKEAARQISFFGPKSPVAEELERLDINSLTPLEAINKLYELQKKAREG